MWMEFKVLLINLLKDNSISGLEVKDIILGITICAIMLREKFCKQGKYKTL
jgi:hypothetical protein